jgi:large subunit ribosomal protein L32
LARGLGNRVGRASRPARRNALARQELDAMQPVQKTSKARKRKRRSHHALTPIQYVRCPQCSSAKLPHAACDNCGYVNPKLALQIEQETT